MIRWAPCFAESFLRRGPLLLIFLVPYAHAGAQTLYVDDDAPASCACGAPANHDDPGCGRPGKPFSCINDAIATGHPFDTIIVRDGTYSECVNLTQGGPDATQRRTIKAENVHGALIACPTTKSVAFYIRANFVTVQGFRITGGNTGIYIAGAEPGRHDAGTGIVLEDAEVFGSDAGVLLTRNCAGVRLSRLDLHHNTSYDGLKLEKYPPDTSIADTVIEDSHIHHNHNNGIHEVNAERTVIRNSEVDNNGTNRYGHGLYMKGFEGLIQNNKVHHNTGYGIHLWAAPRGTSAHHYIAEQNDVFANGSGGVVLGGSTTEASPAPPLPPGDGFPHYVEIRRNRIHHNPGTGFVYYGGTCESSANDNSFHDNTVYDNGERALLLSALHNDARMTRLVLKDNVFVGPPYTPGAVLALLINTNLDAGVLDGNTYYMPGADPSTPGLFRWRCDNCRTPPDADVSYSFDQFRNSGINQDNRRRPDLNCGAPTTVKLGERSQWVDPHIVETDAAPRPN